MRSAIDTNVISALWARQPAADEAERLLLAAREQGGLVICGAVYAELLSFSGVTVAFVDEFLSQTSIDIEGEPGKEIWQHAGLRFAKYSQRRRKSNGGAPKRLLADFFIGSHALLRANRLLTFNEADYQVDYPVLKVTRRVA